MKWQPGKSPSQQLAQNMRAQSQRQWQRNLQGGYWLQQQKKKWAYQQKPKTTLLFNPSAAIDYTWPEFNTQQDNEKGMHIHVAFSIVNLVGRVGTVAAYFYSANGEPLKDLNLKYSTRNGHVCVTRSFVAPYNNTRYDDFVLFMPYHELHRGSGNHSLKFFVDVWDDKDRELTYSEWVSFSLTSS